MSNIVISDVSTLQTDDVIYKVQIQHGDDGLYMTYQRKTADDLSIKYQYSMDTTVYI